ncbi:DNA polymerase III subunit delta [Lutibaculum baratangense]|uniref:DNA-directed DNA polymerase n=1 Tax=Lutibaculum baratangense AMV1 TaxID=631454 RepID=V4RL88_9HYPH|nr:DNA polymerase III subunit delta [Lutibaculum baratangense]ESR26069.1 DNA polymerase III delta subunit [Lutibaculum baratangense AMV1]
MVALKGPAIDRFLDRPDRMVVLVYGPDTGLVTERAGLLVKKHLRGDDMGRVVIDGDSLSGDPGKLVDEAHSVPMFGGRQAIRVTPTSKNIAPALAAILGQPPAETIVVFEAGDLKPSAPLRKMVEASDAAVALPCYVDDEAAVDRLITQEAEAAGLRVANEARSALRHLLGGDRLASRGELAKLATYCMGSETIELADVVAVCGDASALELDEITDAAFIGDVRSAEHGLHRALEAGVAPASIVGGLTRHLMQLMVARERIDGGATADAAMRELRPPVFFKRQPSFRRQLSLWSADALGRMLPHMSRAEADTRLRAEISTEIVSRLIMAVASVPSRR